MGRLTLATVVPLDDGADEKRMAVAALDQENERIKAVLLFALLCILESISYTRKDGQYLRWDYRSGRRQGEKKFDKGVILSFDKAITNKLHEIITDLRGVDSTRGKQRSFLHRRQLPSIDQFRDRLQRLLFSHQSAAQQVDQH